MNDNEIFATWFDNVVGRRLYYRGLIGFFMKRKRENKKLPCKKHSRKMDAEVKKNINQHRNVIYQFTEYLNIISKGTELM